MTKRKQEIIDYGVRLFSRYGILSQSGWQARAEVGMRRRAIRNNFGSWSKVKGLIIKTMEDKGIEPFPSQFTSGIEVFTDGPDLAEKYFDKDTKNGSMTITTHEDGTTTVVCHGVKTVEDALEQADIDQETFNIISSEVRSWPLSMKLKTQVNDTVVEKPHTIFHWYVSVKLRPKTPPVLETAITSLIETMPVYKPLSSRKPVKSNDWALSMELVDAHMGKMAWAKETGQWDYDLKLATQDYLYACEENIRLAKAYDISKIFYITGQDFFHVENLEGVTPKGKNKLDIDARLGKIIEVGEKAILEAIYMCADVAEVECIWIPGNHDPTASMWLQRVLLHHFQKDDRVVVDWNPMPRKARLWGKTLLVWTHDASGRKANVSVNYVPNYFPEEWGKSEFRELHSAHKHKMNEVRYIPTQTLGSLIIRQVPGITAIDAWHSEEIWTDAVPAGGAFLVSKKSGVRAAFTTPVGPGHSRPREKKETKE